MFTLWNRPSQAGQNRPDVTRQGMDVPVQFAARRKEKETDDVAECRALWAGNRQWEGREQASDRRRANRVAHSGTRQESKLRQNDRKQPHSPSATPQESLLADSLVLNARNQIAPPAVPELPWPLFNEDEPKEARAIGRHIHSIVEAEARNGELSRLWELSPGSVKKLISLQANPNALPKHKTAIQFMMARQLFRMERTVPELKTKGLFSHPDGIILELLQPKDLTHAQNEQMVRILKRMIEETFNSEKKHYSPPSAETVDRLEQVAARFKVQDHLTEIRESMYIQRTNGVQHLLLPNRVGPPLQELNIATYNMEHFSVVQYDESKLQPTDIKKYSPAKQVIVREEMWDALMTAIVKGLRKVRRLGETLMHKKDETTALPDVVALQEVKNMLHLRYFLKLNHLEDRYPNVLFFPPTLGDDGLAILATNRVRIHSPNRVVTKGTPRPSGEVIVDMGDGKELALFNVHFRADKYGYDHEVGEAKMKIDHTATRLSEASSLGRRVSELRHTNPKLGYVLIGDCNTDKPSVVSKMSHLTGLSDVPQKPSEASHPHGNLDRVFLGGKVKCESMEVVGNIDHHPHTPSDHLMMRIKLRMK